MLQQTWMRLQQIWVMLRQTRLSVEADPVNLENVPNLKKWRQTYISKRFSRQYHVLANLAGVAADLDDVATDLDEDAADPVKCRGRPG